MKATASKGKGPAEIRGDGWLSTEAIPRKAGKAIRPVTASQPVSHTFANPQRLAAAWASSDTTGAVQIARIGTCRIELKAIHVSGRHDSSHSQAGRSAMEARFLCAS